ncbi:MAG: WYL domain-containing protein [Sphaerochaetaceae bacterium]|nr:WYL domain-containing protein [Sphaerochaetaceae bacterium]
MSKMSGIDTLSRLVKVIKCLTRPNGATITEISEETGIDRWTVKDMIVRLETLKEDGYGLVVTEAKDAVDKRMTRYSVSKDCMWSLTIPGLQLSDDEAFFLSFMLSEGEHNPDLHITTSNLRKKLELFKNIQTYEVLNVNTVKKTTKHETQKVLLTILKAVKEHKCIRFNYKPFQRPEQQYEIVPYGIFKYDFGYYIISQKLPEGEERIFGAERIIGIPKIIDYQGTLPEKLDFLARFNDPFGPFDHREEFEAILKFNSSAGLFHMELAWPGVVKVEQQKDETVIMHAKTRSVTGIKRWIFSYGSSVQVLEPQWLKEEIRAEHLKAAEAQ